MSSRRSLAGAVLAVGLLSGCADPKDASEANFAQVLTSFLADRPRCITGLPLGESMAERDRRSAMESYRLPRSSMEALVRAGLLRSERRIVDTGKPRYWLTPSQRREHARGSTRFETVKDTSWIYSLTPEGEKASQKSESGETRLCYGTPRLEQVVRWTEPGDQFGQHLTQVTYTYSLADVPAWVEDADVRASLGLDRELSRTTPREERAVLVLASDGWRVADGN